LIVSELLRDHPEWTVSAVGGPAMERAGAQLLYDLTKNSVVGLVEVLRHYGTFRNLFNGLLDWVREYRPKAVVLVDYPGFNLRFADAMAKHGISRKGGGEVMVYQYVSPQIWAWKAKRRFKMAKVLDELGVIFPFEIDCYADTGLPVHFVGHPFAQTGYENPLNYDPDGPLLFLPGSRKQAVTRIFPVMLQTLDVYRASGGKRSCICLYPEDGIRDLLSSIIERSGIDVSAIELRPVESGAHASAVLTSSGTMSLNCALAGIPGAVVYRAHPLTALIGRRLINIEWLGIANLILGREQYPEYLQSRADPAVLAQKLATLSTDLIERERFEKAAGELLHHLQSESTSTVAKRIDELLTV
jgi:lipid-A-disaccharide synthase